MTSTDMIIAALPHKSPAERLLDKGSAVQQADARRMLDAMTALFLTERQKLNDLLLRMTIPLRVVAAFLKQPATETETEEKSIRALLDNLGSTTTDHSRACGWKGHIWYTHAGTLCKKREAALWPADPAVARDGNFYSGILADLDPDGNRFTMKPGVAAAFAELGLTARGGARKGTD